ncbi:sodium-dependent bicarbonate transport family permease [bacterium]|nr:sodium-dependent bicarbonate transport family permease [bacterium]
MTLIVSQLQSPTLSFLIGGMILAAFRSQLQIPEAINKFVVFMLLMRIGLSGGISIRNANLAEMLLPAAFAAATGILIVFIGRFTLAKFPNIKMVDALATAGLFGAVSGSTMAAALTFLEESDISYEPWAVALYPFMDISALVTAIVLASLYSSKQNEIPSWKISETGIIAGGYPHNETREKRVRIWPIIWESLQGYALSALLLGLAIGIFANPERVYESFFDPLFRGFLSILMLVMGIEATERLNELRKVGQWYALYAVVAPLFHGLIAFGLGMIAHRATGFSLGGVVILAVIAASSSDISGPPTLRAGIPSANPSAYIGASTAVGTPVAIAIAIPLFVEMAAILSRN